ncbi:MAG: hypothetical protein RSG77_21815 [Hafnia sp.]
MTVISTHPTVSQFVGVTHDQIVDFGVEGKFRVLVYAAYNSYGLIGPEHNGVAILRESPASVVVDELGIEASGYDGPSEAQVALFNKIVAMDWKTFRATANASSRSRFDI